MTHVKTASENYVEIGQWLPAGNTLSFESPHLYIIFRQIKVLKQWIVWFHVQSLRYVPP